MTSLATCAGFAADVLPEIRRHGARVELGDHVPFTELFGAMGRGLVPVLVAAAVRQGEGAPLAVEEMLGEKVVAERGVEARPLLPDAVRALAAIDDLRVSALWREAWTALGRSGEVPADLTQAIRGLVVQARAAVANGWDVFVVEGP